MLATAAWLSWVLGQQAGIDAVLALVMGAVFVGLAAWLYGRFVQSSRSRLRGAALILALTAFAGGAWLALSQAASGEAVQGSALPGPPARGALASSAGGAVAAGAWQPWSEQRIADALAGGHPVFVDFTAAWFGARPTSAWRSSTVGAQRIRAGRVVRLRAGWTQRSADHRARQAQRNGVPPCVFARARTTVRAARTAHAGHRAGCAGRFPPGAIIRGLSVLCPRSSGGVKRETGSCRRDRRPPSSQPVLPPQR
jgi:thiol:disulfide interchange protein DsbD